MLAKLEKFKATISAKPVESNSKPQGGKGEDLSDWAGVKLKFATEPGKVCFIFLYAFQYDVLYGSDLGFVLEKIWKVKR